MWYHVFSGKKEKDIFLLLRLTDNLARKKIDEIDKIIVYYLSKNQE